MWSPVIIMYVWCVINVCRHDQHPGACCLSAVKQGEHGNRPRVTCSTHKEHRDAHALSKQVSSISWLPVANPYALLKCFLTTR